MTARQWLGSVAAALALVLSPALAAQDVDPPVVSFLESGAPLVGGQRFGRPAVPVVEVTDASAVTVDLVLDGLAHTAGSTVSTEGTHELGVTATDAAQNVTVASVSFVVDLTPPEIGAIEPADGAIVGATTVVLTGQAVDAVSVTVDGVAATLAGGTFVTDPLPLAAEGSKSFTVVATDATGLTHQRVHRIVRDTTVPAVAISQPLASQLLAETPVEVFGTGSDLHLLSIEVNGVAAVVSGGTWVARNVPLAEGPNSLVATARDRAGNEATATRSVTLDTRAPELQITDPAPGTLTPAPSIPVSGLVVEPHLDRILVAGVRATVAAGAFTATVPLAEGVNSLLIEAFDRAGHGTTTTVTVTRDSQAPAIRILTPLEGSFLGTATTPVSGTVEEEENLTVTLNGGAVTRAPGAFSVADVALIEGENPLTARVTDGLGNQGAHTRLVFRDSVAPDFVSADPPSGASALDPGSRFRLTFSEEIGGEEELGSGAVVLELAGGGLLPVDLVVTGRELTIVPRSPLPSEAALVLRLTAGIVDRAGNGLATPQTLTYSVADVEAPAAPLLTPLFSSILCAARAPIAGTTEPEATVEITGGASVASIRAAPDGAFSLSVDLRPGVPQRLLVTARDPNGNVSVASAIDLVHDCTPPVVLGADWAASESLRISFSEPVSATNLNSGSTLRVVSTTGDIAGTWSLAGTVATFTPAVPPLAGAFAVTVTTAVRDLAGNPLATAFTRTFGDSTPESFVTGRVLDAATGRPLAGALVVVDSTDGVVYPEPQPSQTTGPDGRFRIAVPSGTHCLIFLRQGYSPVLRAATSLGGRGVDVFDPRLTPLAPLSATGTARATPLDEQSLPALLPYGWSPAAAVWVDLPDAPLGLPAAHTFDVEDPNGSGLALVHLDLATLQWHVEELVTVAAGQVVTDLSAEGGWALVRADAGASAPPAATPGAVLSSSPVPVDPLLGAATVGFQPEIVLPHQASRATILVTLDPTIPAGVPVTVTIRESLMLLDGTVVAEPPFEADLVLYRSVADAPRARFALAPSAEARRVPLQLGAEDLVVRRYAGETVRGNVLGPLGGNVASLEGDAVELPPGALVEPVGVSLARRAEIDLGLTLPTSLEFLGALDLDLGGRTLAQPATLRLELGVAGGSGQILLFEIRTAGATAILRPVALATATATGYATAPIDDNDLPWPGVRTGATYVFARSLEPLGYFRGTVTADTTPVPGAPISAVLSSSTQLFSWSSFTRADGRYVFPAPLTTVTLTAVEPATSDRATASGTLTTVDERVDLPLAILPTGPFVVETTPADGATDQPAGTEPTVRFSELVDPATVAAGLFLEDADTNALVPTNLQLQGTTARLIPRGTLTPGATYRIRATSAVRDLTGRLLSPAVTTSFTVRAVTLADDIDLSRVHALEPDAFGRARILGRPGAVPAGSLVFVENTSRLASTPSVTAGADGSFDLEIEAGLADRLLLHVLPPGRNETLAPLPPFLSRDGLTGYVDSRPSRFTTLEGITVQVPAGAFTGPVEVTVVALSTARPRELPLPEDFTVRGAFSLDFVDADGSPVDPLLPLDVRLAATASGSELLLAHRWRPLGAPRWMLYDLLRQDGAEWTTEDPATAGTSPAAAQSKSTNPGQRPPTVAAGVGGGGFEASAGTGPAAALESAPAAATLTDRKRRLPGIFDSGRYLLLEPASPLDYLVLPFSLFDSLFVQSTSLSGMAVGVSPRFATQLALGLLVPTRRGQPLGLVGRDLSTGFEVFRTDAPPPQPGEIANFAPDPGDHEPPAPVDGTPFRFVPIRFDQNGLESLGPGTTAELTGGTLRITFAAGTLAEGSHATLVALAGGSPGATVRTGASGEVTLSLAAQLGKDYLLAVGAPLSPTGTIRISFSEALRDGFAGLLVRAPNGRDAQARITPLGSREVLEIAPAAGWQAGGRYALELGPQLSDAQGNAWGVSLTLPFEIEKSQVLGNIALTEVRDTARLGDWLFVAAGPQGLGVIDVSNPLALPAVGGVGAQVYPFPLADPVQGLAVDPHGRVLVTGGGIAGFGQLKIFDPLTESYAGSTLVSDPLGNNLSSLPEGSPRRVAVLSEDTRDALVAGGAPPAGVTVETAPLAPAPSTAVRLTLRGTATPKLPVSLFNRTRGRWARVDADAAGAFAVSIDAEPSDALELLRNERSLAYVVVRGVGIGVVDVNAFYREEHGDVPATQSDLLGFYTGQEDPNLQLCNQPVFEIGSAILDLAPLADPDPAAPHRLTVAGLVGFRGVALFESDPIDLGDVRFYNESCLRIEGNAAVSALEVLTDYAFRSADLASPAEPRDYLLVTHRTAGLLILDADDRDNLILAARIPLPIEAAELTVDRTQRKAYVSGTGGGLAIVDLDRPLTGLPRDLDGDGRDDRVLEVIELPGNVNAPALVIPELGLAFAGGVDGSGLTAISIAEPRIEAVKKGEEGELGRVEETASHGVPTAAGRDLPGSFRVLASLPGLTADEIRLDVTSLGPGGEEIDGAGDPATTPGLPPTHLTGDDALVLRRLSSDPRQDGHHLYLSEEIAVVADLRAAPDYTRTTDENASCPRCETTAGVKSILAGNTIAVRLPASLSTQLQPLYGPQRISHLGLQLASTPWETTCSPDQEPAQNASTSAAGPPGVFLHSGELTMSAVDLTLPGIGLDLVVARHYRSGTIGNGPLGPGWELGFRQRLRELPNGDVEYRDGTGRCETFRKRADGQGYESPSGVFVDLARLHTGWQLQLTHGEALRFDRWGRLIALGDRSRRAEDRGNEIQFAYDSRSRLTQIRDDRGRIHRLDYDARGRLTALMDFEGRTTQYAYDAASRLTSVTSPPILSGAQPFPAGLITRYRYEEVVGGTLAAALHQAGDLVAWVDAEGQDRTTWTFTDANGDARTEEVTSASWAGGTATVAYNFTARTATITDRAGLTEVWQHDEFGHPTQRTDVAGGTWSWSYDSQGNVTEQISAIGIRQSFTYPTEAELPARALANLEHATTTPAPGVPSLAEQVDTYEYDPDFNETTSWNHNGEARIAAKISAEHGQPEEITEAPESVVAGTRRSQFDSRGRLTRHTDEAFRTFRLQYAGDDLAAVEQLGVTPSPTTRFEYDARKNVTAVIDPRGTRTERVYDERDRLIEESIPGTGVKTEYVYDALDRVVEIRRAAGDDGSQTARTRVTYLPGRNQPSTLERELTPGVFAVETRTYDEAERLIGVVGPEGETTEIGYLDAERKVTVTRTGPGLLQAVVEVHEYDAEGRQTAYVDGRGQRWVTEYDVLGRLSRQRDPLGDNVLIGYDDNNRPSVRQVFGSAGCLWAESRFGFDARGRRVSERAVLFEGPPSICLGHPIAAQDFTTSFQYDIGGRLVSVVDPLGRTRELRDYDPAGRLVRIDDAVGNSTTYTLDSGGLPTDVTIREGDLIRQESHRYDALGRRTETKDGLGQATTFTYDAAGNPRLVVDPAGTFTETVYDLANRPISTVRPEGIRVNQTFDQSDRLTGYADALGNLTSYTYDALGRRTTTVYPDSTVLQMDYDGGGQPILIADARGNVQSLSYDPVGRLGNRTVTPGPGVVGPTSEAFQYDAVGRLIRAQSGTGPDAVVTERSFDTLSRLVGETQNGRAVASGFDPTGARTAITYPSANTYQFAVDALGRPTDLALERGNQTSAVAGFAYQGLRRSATVLHGELNSTLTANTLYDLAGRPTARGWSTGLSESLAWTPKNLLESITRSPATRGHSVFDYDQAGRLKSADLSHQVPSAAPIRRDAFTYDSADNLLIHGQQNACEAEDSTVSFPLDSSGRNRPAKAGHATLEWDQAGNLTRKGPLRFLYDYKHRLTVVTDLEGTEVARYTYDAFNRRVKKQVGSVVTETVWDAAEPIEEYVAGTLRSHRVFGPDLGELVQYHFDPDGDGEFLNGYLPVFDVLGNLVELRHEFTGEIVERYEYSAYGERRILAPDVTPPRIEQIIADGGEIRIEVSEEVDLERVRAALPGGLSLRSQITGLFFSLVVDQPVTSACGPSRRLVIQRAEGADWPTVGESVELLIGPEVLADSAGNVGSASRSESFPWPAQSAVIHDGTPPRVTALSVDATGRLLLVFSETPNLARLASVATVDGAPRSWTLSADGYSVRTSTALAAGSHTVSLSTAPLDLIELGLERSFVQSFEVDGELHTVFREPEPGELVTSAAGNTIGFRGLGRDDETGLLYARNRYYDPEMGRFITADPLGYLDGPNAYSYGMNSPANYSDPLGLFSYYEAMVLQTGAVQGVAEDLGGMALGLATLPLNSLLTGLSEARQILPIYQRAGIGRAIQYSGILTQAKLNTLGENFPIVGSVNQLGRAIDSCVGDDLFQCGRASGKAGLSAAFDIGLVGAAAGPSIARAGSAASRRLNAIANKIMLSAEFFEEAVRWGILEGVAAEDYITLYRGQRAGIGATRSYLALLEGDEAAWRAIEAGDLATLMRQHAMSSKQPPSPLVSLTSDRRVAEFFGSFSSPKAEILVLQLPKNRAIFNEFNQLKVPAGPRGLPIPEAEWLVRVRLLPGDIVWVYPLP